MAAGVWGSAANKKTERGEFIVTECSSGMNDNAALLSAKRCGVILLLYCYLIRFQDNLTCRSISSSSSSSLFVYLMLVFIEHIES